MGALMRRPALLPAVAAVVASIAGIANDFVYDDKAMLVDVTRLQGLHQWRDILSQPYWPPPFFDNLYRPGASLFLALEYALGGGGPLMFRLVSIVLYALSAAVFYALASRLTSRGAALAASILWAVHPVHVEAVAQAVNQGELVVSILSTGAVIAYLDARRAGWPTAKTWSVVVGAFVLAILFKESGFVLPALIFLVEATLLRDTPVQTRMMRLWPGFLAMALVAAVMLVIRGQVLSGGVLTANPSAALRGADLGDRLFAMLQVVPQWLRLLVFPLRLQVDFSPAELGMPDHFGIPEASGLVLLLATAVALASAWRRSPAFSFGLAWCAIALLPVSNIVPVYIMLAERTLFLPSSGFLIAVGVAAAWVSERSARARQVLLAACAAATVFGVVRSTSRHLVWNSEHIRVKSR